MYKMLVCDLDETLLCDDKTIGTHTVEMIKKAVHSGLKFVPNTGRSFMSVQDNLRELGLSGQAGQYVISYNGATIVENKANRVVQTAPLAFETMQKLFELGYPKGLCVHVYTVDELYIWNMNQAETDYLTGRVPSWQEMEDPNLDFLENQTITKIIFHVPAEADRIAFRKEAQALLTEPLNIAFSSDRYVEFNDLKADKGQAALALGAKLGIKPDEIIAVGDNGNDLPMIKACGLGVCVANGRQFVKDVADYTTENDNNHDAVAEVIEKFVL